MNRRVPAKQRAARYFPCIAFSRICASRYEEPGWVAHSGLDPVHHQSGSSVHKPSRISRAAIPTTEPASCPSSRSRPVPTLPREKFSTPLQRDKYLDPQERIFATDTEEWATQVSPLGHPPAYFGRSASFKTTCELRSNRNQRSRLSLASMSATSVAAVGANSKP